MQRQPMKDDSEKHLSCCEIYNRNHGENFYKTTHFQFSRSKSTVSLKKNFLINISHDSLLQMPEQLFQNNQPNDRFCSEQHQNKHLSKANRTFRNKFTHYTWYHDK